MLAGVELALLAPEEGRGGCVGHRGDARLEEPEGGAAPVGLGRAPGFREHAVHGGLQLALVVAAGAPEQIGVAEVLGLQEGEQLRSGDLEVDGGQPGAQQRARIFGAEVGADRARPRVALGHHPLDHLQHSAGVGSGGVLARPQRSHGDRHGGVGPLRG